MYLYMMPEAGLTGCLSRQPSSLLARLRCSRYGAAKGENRWEARESDSERMWRRGLSNLSPMSIFKPRYTNLNLRVTNEATEVLAAEDEGLVQINSADTNGVSIDKRSAGLHLNSR